MLTRCLADQLSDYSTSCEGAAVGSPVRYLIYLTLEVY